jgi:feruloyl esterase
MVALALQDPSLATPAFSNAKANGADSWKSLTYEQLSKAFDAAIALQPRFGLVNTDDPDLSAFKARGGKLIEVHGMNDGVIFSQGSVQYYESVLARMGGYSAVQDFYRFYLIPGMGHGPLNGTSNPDANPPYPAVHKGEIYKLLTDWVEKGIPAENVVLHSAAATPVAKSLPMCAYPKKATYTKGNVFAAESYQCR